MPDPANGGPTKDQTTQLSPRCRGSRRVPCQPPAGCPVCEFPQVQVSCLCGFPQHDPNPTPCIYSSYTFSTTGLLELSPVPGLESLHLLSSSTGRRLHDGKQGNHQSDHRGRPVKASSPPFLGVLPGIIPIGISLAPDFSPMAYSINISTSSLSSSFLPPVDYPNPSRSHHPILSTRFCQPPVYPG